VRHYLDPEFMRVKPAKPRYKTLHDVAPSLTTALGTLAHLGQGNTEQAFNRGCEIAGLNLTLPPLETADIRQFSRAIERLANCYPLLKVTILKAIAAVARTDGVICPRELTLIKAIAAVIDCPLPNQLIAGIIK
jgi:hypothetical protein